MAAHRYWRCRNWFNKSNQTGVGNLQMANTVGGTNLCTGGTPFASGSYGGSYAVTSAFDGNANSNWFSAGAGNNVYIGYDLGAGNEAEINEVRMGPGSEDNNGYPRMFYVESSDDDVTYTLEWIGGGLTIAGSTTYSYPRPTPTQAARYWSLIITETTHASANSDAVIAEMELLSSTVDQTGSGTATATNNGSGLGPANAFDDNTATIFYHNSTSFPCMITYDLGSVPSDIDQFSLQSSVSDGFNNQQRNIEDGFLFGSTDGRSWFVMKTLVDEPVWGSLEKRTYDLDGVGGGGSPVRRRMIVVT